MKLRRIHLSPVISVVSVPGGCIGHSSGCTSATTMGRAGSGSWLTVSTATATSQLWSTNTEDCDSDYSLSLSLVTNKWNTSTLNSFVSKLDYEKNIRIWQS